jgi:hypothetical protein
MIILSCQEEIGDLSESKTMQWELIVALIIAVPIILFPAAYVWYLNIGGICTAVKEARARRTAREKREKAVLEAK